MCAVLTLNRASKGPVEGVSAGDGRTAHILPIAPSQTASEVDQLEVNRATILQGMRDGARRVFEIFLPAMDLPSEFTPDSLVDMIFPLSILNQTVDAQIQTESVTYGMSF